MRILNPVGEAAKAEQRVLPVVGTLEGLRVAVLNNHWRSMDRMTEHFRARAVEKYATAEVTQFDVPINGAMSAAVEQRVLADCDVAIVGLAN